MKEVQIEQNIESKLNDSLPHNPKTFYISNDSNDYNNIKSKPIINSSINDNSLNEKKNYSSKSINTLKYPVNDTDTLYGNSFIKYYLNSRKNNKNNIQCVFPKKMGNFYTYFFYQYQPIIVLGNKKLSLVIIYESILQISFFCSLFTFIQGIFIYIKYIFIVLYLNCFISHMFIFLLNPGIPSPDHYKKIFANKKEYKALSKEKKNMFLFCDMCNIIIDPKERIEHCDECDICISKYDHHCYWTGKCIGKNNIIVFYLFLFGTLFYIIWLFTIIIFWLVLKMKEPSHIKGDKKF